MIVTKYAMRHKETKLFGSYIRRKNGDTYIKPVELSRARIFARRRDVERAISSRDNSNEWEIIELQLKVPYWL